MLEKIDSLLSILLLPYLVGFLFFFIKNDKFGYSEKYKRSLIRYFIIFGLSVIWPFSWWLTILLWRIHYWATAPQPSGYPCVECGCFLGADAEIHSKTWILSGACAFCEVRNQKAIQKVARRILKKVEK